jgi:pSer/pThr/pTyr-binding forkhead associated (FHA) protein
MQFAAVVEDTPVEADFPVLEVTAGAEQGTEIAIDSPVVTFGRATNNATWDIKLRDQAVSRPHARLELVEGVWYLTDLGSVNGTFVNGHPVHQSIVMQEGMVIIMGETQMVFRQRK